MRVLIGVVASLALTTGFAPIATAGVSDPNDTRGPLDIRRVHLEELPWERLRLTVRFWSGGFQRRYLGRNDPHDGLRVSFRLPAFDDVTTYGFTFRKHGHLRLRQGDFGSSICCWSSRLRWIRPDTFRTVFLPWWIRLESDQHNEGIKYKARTRVCRVPCLADRTDPDVVT